MVRGLAGTSPPTHCNIGVTTGVVFAGPVGNSKRCEYAVIGDVVNLSARLMSAAQKLSKDSSVEIAVLCDEVTAQDAATGVRFQRLPPIKVRHPDCERHRCPFHL